MANQMNSTQKEPFVTRFNNAYRKYRLICWYIMVFFMAFVSLVTGKIGTGILFFIAGIIDLPPITKRFPNHKMLLTVVSIILAVIACLLYQS